MTGLLYLLRKTLICSLYLLLSISSKKSLIPKKLLLPLNRMAFFLLEDSKYGLLISIPSLPALLISCCFHHLYAGLFHGSIAPFVKERLLSGIIRSSSYLRILPNPLQSGHAPTGWLKEKRRGYGFGKSILHSSQAFSDEKVRVARYLPPTIIIFILPFPSFHAISIESDNLGSSFITSLSSTILKDDGRETMDEISTTSSLSHT